MNRFFYILLLVLFAERSFSQEIFTIVEESAEFPGGTGEMMKFIQKNLQYPSSAQNIGNGGKAFLKFVVNASGDISNVELLKGVKGCHDCDKEAIRVVKSMPKWKPAKMSGRTVHSYYNLPINFSPNEIKTEDTERDCVFETPEIFTIVEEQAEFPGGSDSLKVFILKNLNYPQKALNSGIGGKCFLKFVVSSSGNICNVQVLKGVKDCAECDREAMRVVKSMPKWKPGRMVGQPVNVFYNLPINFKSN